MVNAVAEAKAALEERKGTCRAMLIDRQDGKSEPMIVYNNVGVPTFAFEEDVETVRACS
jgi:hypothetical protein